MLYIALIPFMLIASINIVKLWISEYFISAGASNCKGSLNKVFIAYFTFNLSSRPKL